MGEFYKMSPEEAKEITGVSFTVAELKNSNTAWLIRKIEGFKDSVDTKSKIIILLSEKLERYQDEAEKKDQSKTASKSSLQMRNPYLRVV